MGTRVTLVGLILSLSACAPVPTSKPSFEVVQDVNALMRWVYD